MIDALHNFNICMILVPVPFLLCERHFRLASSSCCVISNNAHTWNLQNSLFSKAIIIQLFECIEY